MTATTTFEGMKASAMTAGAYAHIMDPDGFIIPAKFDQAFGDGACVMEEKLDGHRAQIVKVGDAVTTTLRSTPLPAHIIAELRKLPFDVHLDGELLVPGGVSNDVPNLLLQDSLVYVVFDVIELMGQNVTGLHYTERRAFLEAMAPHMDPTKVGVVAVADVSWAGVQAIWDRGGEGVVVKRKTSTYMPGHRSPDWIKVKKLEQHTVTVTGFDTGSFGPTAVVLFRMDDGTEGRAKNRNNETLTATAANPAAYIGRRVVIQCQQRMRGSKSPRHPMIKDWQFDHDAGAGE